MMGKVKGLGGRFFIMGKKRLRRKGTQTEMMMMNNQLSIMSLHHQSGPLAMRRKLKECHLILNHKKTTKYQKQHVCPHS